MSRNIPTQVRVALALIAGLSPLAAAQSSYTIVSAQRSVSASASAALNSDSDSAETAGTEAWDEQVTASIFDEEFGGSGSALAAQNSQFLSDTGYVLYAGTVQGSGSTDGLGSASSRLELRFSVDSPTRFTLDGSITSSIGAAGSSVRLALLNPNGVARFDLNEFDLGLDESGTTELEPIKGIINSGPWTLILDFQSSGFEDATDSRQFDLTFFLPNPGTLPLMGLGLIALGGRRRPEQSPRKTT